MRMFSNCNKRYRCHFTALAVPGHTPSDRLAGLPHRRRDGGRGRRIRLSDSAPIEVAQYIEYRLTG